MAITIKKTGTGAKIDQGYYGAVIKGVSIELSKKPSAFGDGRFLKWVLQVHKPLRDGVVVVAPFQTSYLTGMTMTNHPKNKLNNFLKAVGMELEEGEDLDVELAVGKRVMIMIKDQETDTGTFSQITDVSAAPKKAAQAAPAVATPPPAPKAAPVVAAKAAKVAAPVAPPVVEDDFDDAPPVAAPVVDDELGDIDEWASLD